LTDNSFVGNYFSQNYKICEYFLQNLLWIVFYIKYFTKKLVTISCNFFYNKICNISYEKKFKTKLTRNLSFFFSSMTCIKIKMGKIYMAEERNPSIHYDGSV